MARRLEAWRREGLLTVDDEVAERLLHLPIEPDTPEREGPSSAEPSAREGAEVAAARASVEERADALAKAASAFFGEVGARVKQARERASHEREQARQPSAPPTSGRGDRNLDDEGTEAGRAIFVEHRRVGEVVGSGLEALGELDDDAPSSRPSRGRRPRERAEAQPLGALQVFWFIGAVLVLGGSLMGVREAWRALEGAVRPLAIAGAIFAYHVAFVGLARVLARRSAVTGAVLGVIAIGLAPVTFVAAAVGVGMSPALGLPVSLVLLAASGATLTAAGRVVTRHSGLGLAAALAPSLALELALGGKEPSLLRVLVPLGALVPLFFVTPRVRRATSGELVVSRLIAAGAALYGALVVALYALFGGPDEAALPLDAFGGAQLAGVLFVALTASSAWSLVEAGAVPSLFPRASAVARVVSLSVAVGAALTGALVMIAPLTANRALLYEQGPLVFAPAAAVALAAGALALEARRHPLAVHAAIPLAHVAVVVLAAVAYEGGVEVWWAAMGVVPGALLLSSSRIRAHAAARGATIWAAASSVGLVAITMGQELASRPALAQGAVQDPLLVTTALASGLAVAAHAGVLRRASLLHHLGAALAVAAGGAWFAPSRPEDGLTVVAIILVCAAVAYGLSALPHASILRADEGDARPLDDASLLAALLSVACVFLATPGVAPASSGIAAAPLALAADVGNAKAGAAAALLAAALLAARAVRDRSRLVSTTSGLALLVAAQAGVGTFLPGRALSLSGAPFVSGLVTLALVGLATLRVPRAEDDPPHGRALFGLVPLPLFGRGRTLLDGYGLAALATGAVTCARGVGWIASGVTAVPGRDLVVLGLAAVIVATLAVFVSRGLDVISARGNAATLAAGGLVIAITAVAYRIGRPLPPAVVGLRISLVVVGVWLVARVFVARGPKLAAALGRPSHGPLYAYVPHAGVVALTALLAIDALLVGAPTSSRALALVPPLLLVGAAVGAALSYRSHRVSPFLHVSLALAFGAAWLVGAQRRIVGPELVPLDLPGGRWVPPAARASLAGSEPWAGPRWLDPSVYLQAGDDVLAVWDRGATGGALFVAAVALSLVVITRAQRDPDDRLTRPLLTWSAVATAAVALALAAQPSPVAAAVLLAAGCVALAARASDLRVLPLAIAAPTAVHAAAHAAALAGSSRLSAFGALLAPEWAGPLFGALGLGVVCAGVYVSRSRGRDPRALAVTQAAASVYLAMGVPYAMASFGETQRDGAAGQIAQLASIAMDGSFARSPSLAVTVALAALASLLAAWSWRGALATIASVSPPALLAWSASAAACAIAYTAPADVFPRVATRDGPLLGASIAVAGVLSHIASRVATTRERLDAARGLRAGRDAVLVYGALTMSLFVSFAEPGGRSVGALGVFALGATIAVSLDAILREEAARHVYFVEILVVALYAFATRAMDLAPEIDALLGLGYGFTLLGVAVVSRRRKLHGVATATRRFLAVLPVVVAVLTLRGPASGVAAAFAVGSSVLYAAVALTEGSRAFGSLAAFAANVALLVFALAQGLDGVEIWLGPLGLLVAALAQIFAGTLGTSARRTLRILGGVLLYLPSGLKLALRLGAAEDPTYSIVFGAVCIFGVAVGVALKVRAYLALGTLALTLDVIANLVHAGLRDHRLGFVILSSTGLLILGVMITVTLRRDQAWALFGRLRGRVKGWD